MDDLLGNRSLPELAFTQILGWRSVSVVTYIDIDLFAAPDGLDALTHPNDAIHFRKDLPNHLLKLSPVSRFAIKYQH